MYMSFTCLHAVDFTTPLLSAQRVIPLRFVGINKQVYSRLCRSRRPPSCSHPIPTFAHRFSHHPATQYYIVADVPIPSTVDCIIFPSCAYGYNWIIPILIILLDFVCNRYSIAAVVYLFYLHKNQK